MSKPRLLVNDPQAPSLERETLAVAISNHAGLKSALDDNVVNARNTDDRFWTVNRAFEGAKAALEEAKAADAESIATGKPGNAIKSTRLNLQDLEDQLDATRRARVILKDQHADLTNRLSMADGRVQEAVSAVLQNAPEVSALLARYAAAKHEFHDVHGALGVLFSANALPGELLVAVQNIDIREVVHRELPPSATAVRVKGWIAALRTDASAALE